MEIYSRRDLDGGASDFGHTIIETVADLRLTPGRAFDWCSGYGGVGYRLLQQGLCEHLVLGDINPESLDLARQTAIRNDLDNVTIYETDCLDQIPDHERWDLVVGNPPHFPEPDLDTLLTARPRVKAWPLQIYHERIWRDPDWEIHRRFFASVGRFLADDGRIVLCENVLGATPETFHDMITDNGLTYQVRDPKKWPYFILVITRA